MRCCLMFKEKLKKMISGLMSIVLLSTSLQISIFAEQFDTNDGKLVDELVVGDSNSLKEAITTYTSNKLEYNEEVQLTDSYQSLECSGNNRVTLSSDIQEISIETMILHGNTIIDAGNGTINIDRIVWNGGTLTTYGNININQKVEMALQRSSGLIVKADSKVKINGGLDMSLTRINLGEGTNLTVEPLGSLEIIGDVVGYKAGNSLNGYFYPRVTLNGVVSVEGDFIINGEHVYMTEDTGHLYVNGSYKQEIGSMWGDYWAKDCHFTAGSLEVTGDYLYDSIGSNTLEGTHRTIFTGTSKQNVYGIFKNVIVENTSAEGVVFNTLESQGWGGSSVFHAQIWGSLQVASNSVIAGSSTETLLRNPVKSFEFWSQPNKLKYLPNTIFDGTGMELRVTYQNGQEESTFGGWTTEYDFSLPYGEKTVTVEFGGKKNVLKVEVTESIDQPTDDKVQWRDHYYQFFDEKITWKEAKQKCEELGGHLATISSDEEQAIIVNNPFINPEIQYWIGGSNEPNENKETEWGWITKEEWNYENWKEGEPNNINDQEHYLMLGLESENYKWINSSNSNDGITGYICEYELPKYIETPVTGSGMVQLGDNNTLDISINYKANKDWSNCVYMADILPLNVGKVYIRDYQTEEIYFECDFSDSLGQMSIEDGKCTIHAIGLPKGVKMYVDIPQPFLKTINELYQIGNTNDKEWYFTTSNDFAFSPNKDGWKFVNGSSSEGFGYGNAYNISKEKYIYVYGDTQKAETVYESDIKDKNGNHIYWNGNCFGMCTGSLLIKNGFPNINSYSKESIVDLELYDKSNELDAKVESIKDMIETLQISQSLVQITVEKWRNTNNFSSLIESVKANPTIINIYDKDGSGHSLIGYRIENQGDDVRIYVYDPNYPKKMNRYITLIKKDGIYNDWKYLMDPWFWPVDWWSGSNGGTISFFNSTANFEEILKPKLNQDDNMELFSINAEDFVLQNSVGEVASINNGKITQESNLKDLIPVSKVGVALNTNGNIIKKENSNNLYYFPKGTYSLFIQNNPCQVTIAGENSSTLAKIGPSSILKFTTSNTDQYRETTIIPSRENESFEVSYRYSSGADRVYDKMTLQGKTDEEVQINESEHGMIVSHIDALTISVLANSKEVKQEISNLSLYDTVSADVVEIGNNLFLSLTGDKDGDGVFETEIVPPIPFDTVPVEKVTLSHPNIELNVGDTITLSASIVPANASDQRVRWTSSDDNVASVDQFGNIKAINAGVTVVTVTTVDGNKKDICKVTVKEAEEDLGSISNPEQGTTQKEDSSKENQTNDVIRGKTEDEFWDDVVSKIKAATGRKKIVVNAKRYTTMPGRVMEALRQNKGVTLVIQWDGGDPIIIPAGKAQNDPQKSIWTLKELSVLYADIHAESADEKDKLTNNEVEVLEDGALEVDHSKPIPNTGEQKNPDIILFVLVCSAISFILLKKRNK